MFSIADKVAVITGGGSGIGRAIVERFVSAGARVAFCGRSDKSEFADEIGAAFYQTDVANEQHVADMMQQVQGRFGLIDVLVNNAGVWEFGCPIATTDADVYRRGIEVNVLGTLQCIKHGAPLMRDGGAIINISSLSAEMAMPDYASYSISKSALRGLTRTAAIELGDRGIRVIDVCPGTVATEGLTADDNAAAEIEAFTRLTPLQRVCEMDEVAATVHFLAADDCRYITGTAVRLDGGMTAGVSTGLCELLLSRAE